MNAFTCFWRTMANKSVCWQARLAWWLTCWCSSVVGLCAALIQVCSLSLVMPSWEMRVVCSMTLWQLRLRKKYENRGQRNHDTTH